MDYCIHITEYQHAWILHEGESRYLVYNSLSMIILCSLFIAMSAVLNHSPGLLVMWWPLLPSVQTLKYVSWWPQNKTCCCHDGGNCGCSNSWYFCWGLFSVQGAVFLAPWGNWSTEFLLATSLLCYGYYCLDSCKERVLQDEVSRPVPENGKMFVCRWYIDPWLTYESKLRFTLY